MHPSRITHAVLVLIVVLIGGCSSSDSVSQSSASILASGPNAKGTTIVKRVVDGDTVELLGLGKARLIGIDTPEVHGRVECFGPEASSFAKRTLTFRPVNYVVGKEPRDKYGRLLVYLTLRNGTFFNAAVIKRGYAVPLAISPNTRYAGSFRRLAAAARKAHRGLWKACR
ncbi:MAG: thermonuclease family protein [Solirubrobacterales bacterium]|nr:thermonuclease family protein [Solirubrobacterales bacterium]